jgi:HSP20 family molecular chaperone IbpA
VERGHGVFTRTFEFVSKIDVDAVSADLTNGVLTVTLPKAPQPPLRKIEVR